MDTVEKCSSYGYFSSLSFSLSLPNALLETCILETNWVFESLSERVSWNTKYFNHTITPSFYLHLQYLQSAYDIRMLIVYLLE